MIDRSPLMLILYLCGITGFILTVGDVIDLSFQYYFIVLTFTSVLTAVFWFLYFFHNKLFIISSAIFTGLASIIIIPQIFSMSVELKALVIERQAPENLRINMFFIILLTALLTFLLFALEFVMRMHSILLALGIAIIITILLWGHTVSIPNLTLILIFEVGFSVLNMTDKHSGKNVMSVNRKTKINMISSMTAAAIAVAALVPAFAVESGTEKKLFELADTADNYIKEAFANLTGNKTTDGVSNGVINRGNLYRTGKNQLKIYLNSLPESNIYLRGYTGKDYSDSNWSDAYGFTDESEMVSDIYSSPFRESFMNDLISSFFYLSGDERINIPDSFYYLMNNSSDPISEMYFMLSRSSTLNDKYFMESNVLGNPYLEIAPEQEDSGYIINDIATDIYISNLTNKDADTVYIPYYSRDSKARVLSSSKNFGDGYYRNIILTTEEINAYYWALNAVYLKFRNLYQDTIKKEYVNYSPDTPELENYCKQTPLTGLNEITTYILVTLNNHAVYTPTPGNTPYGKDVIDYFLFENGKGYCVHFASAAALMYRMYGIPARYVTGYVAKPSDFSADEDYDGYYSTLLTDYSAHAWVEIFLKNYGWVPVEVTPAEDGSMVTEYPGYDMASARDIMNEHGWHFRDDLVTDTTHSGTDNNSTEEEGSASGSWFIWITPVACIAVCIAVILIRRKRILNKLGTMSCRRLFDRLIRTLHFGGYLKEYTGSEKDFAEKLAECCASLSIEQTERLIEIMLAENYSDTLASKEERDFIENLCRMAAMDIYKKTFFLKKPIFKFIKVYV